MAGSIDLDERDGQIVVTPVHVSESPDFGRMAVVDRQAHQVRVHDSSGELIALRGVPGGGDGPGEFRLPGSAEWVSESLLAVVESGHSRLTLLDRDLGLVAVVELEGEGRPVSLRASNDSSLVVGRPRVDSEVIDVLRLDGRVTGSWHREHPLMREAPYWNADATTHFDVRGHHLVAATSLRYPLTLYDMEGAGEPFDFGTPPAGWSEATVPERGAFAFTDPRDPGPQLAITEWRRSFTRIDRLGFVGDRCVLVVHRDVRPDVPGLEQWDYRADVYETDGWQKIVENAPLPGAVLGTGPEVLFVLDGDLPEPWTLLRWEVEPGGPCLG